MSMVVTHSGDRVIVSWFFGRELHKTSTFSFASFCRDAEEVLVGFNGTKH